MSVAVERLCRECKKPLPETYYANRKFCSDACRIAWWHRNQEKKKAPSEREIIKALRADLNLDAENEWPEGIRNLRCLRCSAWFESTSKVRRLCGPCREANQGIGWFALYEGLTASRRKDGDRDASDLPDTEEEREDGGGGG